MTVVIEKRTETFGTRAPHWRQKNDAQAPPAITTVCMAMGSCSVTMLDTRPADSFNPRSATTGQSVIHIVSYGPKAGLFMAAGIPALICSPGLIEREQRDDEYIRLDKLTLRRRNLQQEIATSCAT